MPKTILFDKQEVLEKVTHLFWEKGYNGTSMQDLVNVTGLNRSSFYNTFKGGKFELFVEALKHYQTSQNQLIQDVTKTAKTPKEVIALLFDIVYQETLQGNAQGCFMASCTAELSNVNDDIAAFLVENMTSFVGTLTKLIKEGQQLGEINPNKDAAALGQYLFSSFQGLRLTSMIDKNPQHIKNISSQILASI